MSDQYVESLWDEYMGVERALMGELSTDTQDREHIDRLQFRLDQLLEEISECDREEEQDRSEE